MELADLPLVLPQVAGSAHMMFAFVCKDDVRDALCEHLEQNGVETRPALPLTNQPYLKGIVNEDDFPIAKIVNQGGAYVGCHPYLSEDDLSHMVKAFRSFFAN